VNHPVAVAPQDALGIKQADELQQPAPELPILSSFMFDVPNLVCTVEQTRPIFLEILSEPNELLLEWRILLCLHPEHVNLVRTDRSILVAVLDHVPLGVTLGIRRGAAFVRSGGLDRILRSGPRLVSVGLGIALSGSAGGERCLVSTRRFAEIFWDVAIVRGFKMRHVSQRMGCDCVDRVWKRQK
jgi:hypothetical protein